jgi:hypothetical protein
VWNLSLGKLNRGNFYNGARYGIDIWVSLDEQKRRCYKARVYCLIDKLW